MSQSSAAYDSEEEADGVRERELEADARENWSDELKNSTPLTCMDDLVTCKCSFDSDCKQIKWVLSRAAMSMRPDHEAASKQFMQDLLTQLPEVYSYYLGNIKKDLSRLDGPPWVISMVDGEMKNRNM